MSVCAEFKVAVVGAGPAGLFATEALLAQQDHMPVRIDVLDRLPAPYGLVRYGVAPDHPTIKSVVTTLNGILRDPAVRFLGNVAVGADLDRARLRACYDAVIYATGAPSDRRLGIPGEDLPGSVSATDLVAWYNGHPDAAAERALDATDAVVVGAGNVALDIARVLTRPASDIARTDVPAAVLSAFRENATRRVQLLARRGAAHAKFSTKELRELGRIEGVHVTVDPRDLDRAPASQDDRQAAANLALFRAWSEQGEPPVDTRTIHLRFCAAPVAVLGHDRVEAVRVERTVIAPDGATLGTGEFVTIPAGLVVRAVGYRGVGIPGLPFDEARGIVPNDAGRVASPAPGAREYVAGWLKRGPSGVIGTNKMDARETVRSLIEDREHATAARGPEIDEVCRELGIDVVPFAGWEAIERAEAARGRREGRERSKIADWRTLRELGLAATNHPITGKESKSA